MHSTIPPGDDPGRVFHVSFSFPPDQFVPGRADLGHPTPVGYTHSNCTPTHLLLPLVSFPTHPHNSRPHQSCRRRRIHSPPNPPIIPTTLLPAPPSKTRRSTTPSIPSSPLQRLTSSSTPRQFYSIQSNPVQFLPTRFSFPTHYLEFIIRSTVFSMVGRRGHSPLYVRDHHTRFCPRPIWSFCRWSPT